MRAKQTFYIPTDSTCSLRFFYQFGSASNSMSISVLRESLGTTIGLTTLKGPTDYSWRYAEVEIRSIEPYEPFVFEIFINNDDEEGFGAIDDITLSNGCHLNDETVCLTPEYYRCKGENGKTGPCIKSSLVGDFNVDCPLGDDEWGHGPCSFEPCEFIFSSSSRKISNFVNI